MKEGLRVGIVGATGAVGKILLSILEERNFPVHELIPFGSTRSQGKELLWKGRSYRCRSLEKGCFSGLDFVFFDASDAVSQEWVPQAAEAGAWVIDNSSFFRLEEDTLLVVPEVNGDLLDSRLAAAKKKELSPRDRIIAGPNCCVAQLVVALKPIQDRWGLKRIVLSTYQSTSGAGTAAMDELSVQTSGFLVKERYKPQVFPHPIAFNCIPHIGSFKDDGNTSEELKIVSESRKLLRMPALRMSATSVRVPTFSCHAESVNIECERPFEIEEVRQALAHQKGVVLLDDPKKNVYPVGLASEGGQVEGAAGGDAVYVGRVRKDPSVECGLNLWVVSDNLRKGAALNAVQLGEILLRSMHEKI
jgi:aspartate-semialdehyde dehydrogenase